MAGGIPGSRAGIPSSPLGTITPPTMVVPDGERCTSGAVVSPPDALVSPSPDRLPAKSKEKEAGGVYRAATEDRDAEGRAIRT